MNNGSNRNDLINEKYNHRGVPRNALKKQAQIVKLEEDYHARKVGIGYKIVVGASWILPQGL